MKFIFTLLFLTMFSVWSQENKTVTLVVSAQGKTQEEAKQNALRSAIEQAFGAFISSKTEIINDELVKDEIVSVSNGNIQKYEVISDLELPSGLYSSTLNATVSVSKLSAFVESKGIEIEFKGSLFATNLKLQKLNEDSEYLAVLNLCKDSYNILSKALDFSVLAADPTQVDGNPNLFKIQYTVECTTNKNYETFNNYFVKSIQAIAMKVDEIANYQSLNKTIYSFDCQFNNGENQNFSFRNINSAIVLQNFFIKSNVNLCNFVIKNDLEEIGVNWQYCEGYCDGVTHSVKMGNGYGESDRWILNGGKAPTFSTTSENNRNAGLLNFNFPNNTNWYYFLHHVYSRSQSYFFNKDEYYLRTIQGCKENGMNPQIYNIFYPTSVYDLNRSCSQSFIPTCFGTLKIIDNSVFYHNIVEYYTLDQLEKISFIKIK